MPTRWLSNGIVFLGASFLLSSCGLPFCVLGEPVNGNNACPANVPYTPSTTASFTALASPTSITVGQTSQVSTSGGVNTSYTYTYSIDPNSNPGPTSLLVGSIDPSSGLYTSATSIAPNTTINVLIRVTDSSGAYNTVTITVNQ